MKKTTSEMNSAIANACRAVPLNSYWYHYKGGLYNILGYAISTIDGEVMIRYVRKAGPGFEAYDEIDIEYVRPFSEWFDIVEDDTVEDDTIRFTRVKEKYVWMADDGSIKQL